MIKIRFFPSYLPPATIAPTIAFYCLMCFSLLNCISPEMLLLRRQHKNLLQHSTPCSVPPSLRRRCSSSSLQDTGSVAVEQQSQLELQGFRPNVGMCIFHPQKGVFAATRIDTPGKHWQMPQGGIDPGETPQAAALRVCHTMPACRPADCTRTDAAP